MTELLTSQKNVIIIEVHGNIGAGKRQFIECLKYQLTYKLQKYDFFIVEEPLDEITPLLKNYYNLHIGGLAIQSLISTYFYSKLYHIYRSLNERYSLAEHKPTVIIIERGISAVQNVFVPVMKRLRYLDRSQVIIINDMIQTYLRILDSQESVLRSNGVSITRYRLYINTPLMKCLANIASRKRTGEQYISIEYIGVCDTLHQEWIKNDISFCVSNSARDALSHFTRLIPGSDRELQYFDICPPYL